METSYSLAPEVADCAKRLLEETEFEDIRSQHFVIAFQYPAPQRAGAVVYATAEVVRGKNAHLYWAAQGKPDCTQAFYRILVSSDLWEHLDEDQRNWLIRHELRHCIRKHGKKKIRLAMRPHDFGLFLADIGDPCMEIVCKIWERVNNPGSGQQSLDELEGVSF